MIPTNSNSGRPLQIWHLLIASALLILLFWLSYPYYRYFVDPDAVAYLTMAKRAAEGDSWRLVNALWSPLHPAIVAALIRLGMDALLAAQLSNLGAAALLLTASFGIFRRVGLRGAAGLPLLLALAGFLCYAIYKQLFCDLFQVAFLLTYLNLLLHPRFIRRPLLWALSALLMALATYAKVYSFYFLLLQFPLSLYLIAKQQGGRFPVRAWMSGLVLQLLLLAPLAGLMHAKYGFWGLSKSGALNTSWTLVGHKSPKAGVDVLIPPPYLNSPYTWEDPYLSEGAQHGRFESPEMMLKQVAVSARACMQAFGAMNELSALLLAVYVLTALYWWRRRNELPIAVRLLTLSAALMPLGYLLLHVEARYFWLLLPIGMALGGYWIGQDERFFRSLRQRRLAATLYAVTFIVWPAYDMKELFRKGEDIHKLAQVLSWMNVRGSFTSNDNPSRAGCLAYWLGVNYYTPVSDVLNKEALLRDMRRWNVNFYLHHQNGLDATTVTMSDETGQAFDRMDGGRVKGLQVFLVNP